MNDKTKHIEMKHAEDADFWDFRRFLRGTDATTGTKSPKDFNMDNPLQAEGAARGIRSSDNNARLMDCLATLTMILFVNITLKGNMRYETDFHNGAQKSRRDDISVENHIGLLLNPVGMTYRFR
jgi:hypothetical protein